MKYIMLIYQGTALEQQAALPEEEQMQVYADYQGINQTPGASLHAETPCDWAQVAALYGQLGRLTGSPVVELNRAIAIAETEGPEAGLRILDELGLDDFRYVDSTRAELLRRLGRTDEARAAYRRARQLTDDGAERRFLERRLTELARTTDPG
jgi:RNA polymerase sigma-70 factor (ECF subfamily)